MAEDVWEIKSIDGNRFGVYKNGICRHVASSSEDARLWFQITQSNKNIDRAQSDKNLKRAIGVLK